MPDLDIPMIREQAAKLAERRGSLEWPAKELPWKVTNHKGSFSASNDAGDEREECDVFESGRESTMAFVVAAVNTPWDEHAVRLCDEVERLRKLEALAKDSRLLEVLSDARFLEDMNIMTEYGRDNPSPRRISNLESRIAAIDAFRDAVTNATVEATSHAQ